MSSYVITGASRGLGYAWIKHLAATSGNTVIGIIRNKADVEARLASDGIRNVHLLSADVTDAAALQQAAEATARLTGGALDFLIHNAAYISPRTNTTLTVLDDTSESLEADLLDHFRANVVGTAFVVNAYVPLIRKGQGKKIVVTTTGMADLDLINRFGVSNGAPYAISKAGTNVLVAKFNASLGKEGVLIFSMSPGLVDTSEGKPPTEEQLAGIKEMGARFASYAPDFKGPLSPEESVKYQLAVINRATVDTFGGSFVSHFGNQQWL